MIESKNGHMNWVRAGHEPALLYNPYLDNFLKLEGEGLPLGVIADQQYRDYSLTLKPGQILALMTDGLIENRNVNGEMFGREKFIDLIRRNAGLGADGIQTRIFEAVTSFQGKAQLEDDMTLVILKLR
jgi:phosphoserine phosphatase RsbU/P